MQEKIGSNSATPARSLDSSTGPAPEANTPAVNCGVVGVGPGAPGGDCHAEITVRISHNRVEFVATLDMGGKTSVRQCWERRRERGTWALTSGPEDFVHREEQVGLELAEFVDGMGFPHDVADMLPGARASAAAVEQAAKAVTA